MVMAIRNILVLAALTACTVAPRHADAYELKKTASGKPIRWSTSRVELMVDPAIDDAVPGGVQAILDSVRWWSALEGAPQIVARREVVRGEPSRDGRNTVTLSKGGDARLGRALAVTILSVDDATGAILDADIVVNGRYAFELFEEGKRPKPGTRPVSVEEGEGQPPSKGHGGDDPHEGFDLRHVVAHELGHALGLGDEQRESTSLMYAYTYPGDATRLRPTADDARGLAVLYEGASSSSGCGAHVASSTSAGGFGMALVSGLVLLTTLRRRRSGGAKIGRSTMTGNVVRRARLWGARGRLGAHRHERNAS